jgi:hypothetical protein
MGGAFLSPAEILCFYNLHFQVQEKSKGMLITALGA